MIALPQCQRCHQTIPDDAPHGACPFCLLQLAFSETAELNFDKEETVLDDSKHPESSDDSPLYTNLLTLAKDDSFGLPRLTNYDLMEELGRGGTGLVFKAQQRGTERLVAVKFLLQGIGSAADRRRFRAEVKALGQLDHPHIVKVFDFGEEDGCPYFSMEYLSGGTLSERETPNSPATHLLQSCLDTPAQAAELVKSLADAMQMVHEAGLLHRDLKPSNILLSSNGTPKIADFGLVKPKADETASQITRTMNVMGSPAYMAPEQAEARRDDVGPATDVYGLGTILYEITTGRIPFRASTVTKTLDKVIHQPVDPPRSLNAQIPKDLEAICLKALAKTPSERYPTAAALAEDLGHFLKKEPVEAKPLSLYQRTKWNVRHQLPSLVFATLLILTLVGTAFAVRKSRSPDSPNVALKKQIDSYQVVPLTNSEGMPRFARWISAEQPITANDDKSFRITPDIVEAEVELLPAEVVPSSYRLMLEIQHEESEKSGGLAGFYFGKHIVKATDGTDLASEYYYKVRMNPWLHEGSPNVLDKTYLAAHVRLLLFNYAGADNPDRSCDPGRAPLSLRPTGGLPKFVQYIVEVRPSGIEMWEVDEGTKHQFVNSKSRDTQELNAPFLHATNLDLLKDTIRNRGRVVIFANPPGDKQWSGSGSFGLLLDNKTKASFRNISIQKLEE